MQGKNHIMTKEDNGNPHQVYLRIQNISHNELTPYGDEGAWFDSGGFAQGYGLQPIKPLACIAHR